MIANDKRDTRQTMIDSKRERLIRKVERAIEMQKEQIKREFEKH